MKSPTPVLMTLLITTLAACGGGDGTSSSGGAETGTSTTNSTGVAAESIHPAAGTYTGDVRMTIAVRNAPGTAVTVTGPITFLIDKNGIVTTDPGTGFSARGRVNGSTLAASADARLLNDNDLTCVGSIGFRGTVKGDSIDGVVTSSGNFACNGVPFVASGKFSVNRTGFYHSLGGRDTKESVRAFIREHVTE